MAKKQLNESKFNRIITLGEVEPESVNDIIGLIYEINNEDAKKTQVEPIKLIINSFGGEIYCGLALVDVIDNSRVPIYTICHGAAMSMALTIFVAGHERFASKNATFMYHEASYNIEAKLTIHRQELKEIERVDQICDDYLISRTDLTQKYLDNIKKTQGDWFFGVEEAKKWRVINEIV